MKKINSILAISSMVALAFTSCDSPDYKGASEKGTGKVDFSTFTLEVSTSETVVESTVKQTSSRAGSDVDNFKVRILDENQAVVKQGAYHEFSAIEVFNVGNYTIDVENGTEVEAAWDAPYYHGTKDFKVEKDLITQVGNVSCYLANVKVTVKYTDALREKLGDDVQVNIAVGNNSLTYVPTETRAGFFKYVSGTNTLTASISGTIGGYHFDPVERAFDAVAPGQHRIITFDIKGTPGILDEKGWVSTDGMLTIDATTETVDVNTGVTVEEETTDPYETIKVSKKSILMLMDASTATFDVESPSAWTLSTTSAPWLTVTPASGDAGVTTVQLSATANNTGAERSATITLRSGIYSVSVAVTQVAAEPEPQHGPVITSETIDLSGVNTVVDGGAVVVDKVDVDIKAEEGIQNFVVDISSTNEGFELAIDDLGLISFDLCNPGDIQASLESLELPYGDQVIGKTAMKFDISSFMSLLPAFTGTHSFKLTVTDSKGNTTAETIRLLVK